MRKNGCFKYAHLILLLSFIGIFPVKAATTITSISQNSSTIGRFEKFELTFTVSQSYTNPFDPCIVDITVSFNEPGGTVATIPAFYYQNFYTSGSNPERYTTSGVISWKARFAPSKLGEHSFDITIRDSAGTAVYTNTGSFVCQDSNSKGFIRVDPDNHAFMSYDNGQTRLNVGHHIGWCSGEVYSWNNYITKMHAAGENWTRLWMSRYGGDGSVILEWKDGTYNGYFHGAGKLSMQTALRLDKFVEIAEANDIAMHLALLHHGLFSTTADSDWTDNPYNVAAGGFLSNPAQFFTNAEARTLTKNKFRYIIARWGYSTSILAWELWNEVQWTDGWNSDQASVVAWHNEMANYIHDIDPFKHPIITSSHVTGFENIWSLPNIDTVQVHYYGMDTIKTFEQNALGLADYNKPIVMEEFGAPEPLAGIYYPEINVESLPEPYKTQMHEALMVHNAIWSSFHLKSSAHIWFWDYYIDTYDLYDEFTALAAYAVNENMANYNLARAQRAVSGTEAYFANPVLTDFYAVSTQTVFTLNQDYFPGMENLSQWLHGSWQSAYKSDPNFHLDMPEAGSLKIHVQSVSTGGNNSLAVLVNGSSVFSSSYANGSSDFVIAVDLAAGEQSVQIKNTGQDWFQISSYEFEPNNISFLDSVGLSNSERAYIWIYDIGSQFGKTANGVFHNEPVIVKELDDGTYNVEVYATRGAGGVIDSGQADSVSGVLTYTLPDFEKDIAVKVKPPCIVDLEDLAGLCDQWLQPGPVLAGSSNVDFDDFSVLAGYWMGQCPVDWPLF